MSIVILLLLIAFIGGGIYWWIRWQRNKALKQHQKLVQDAGLLDQSGSLSTSGLDKLASSRRTAQDADAETIDNTLSDGAAESPPPSATAHNGGNQANNKTRISALEKRIERDKSEIARLADNLLKAWHEASQVVRGWENANSRLLTLKYEIERLSEPNRLDDDEPAIVKHGKSLYEALVVRSSQNRISVENAIKAPGSTIALRNAWQALVSALADYPEEEVQKLFALGRLSKGTAGLVLAAHHARSMSKSSVESLRNDVKELESTGTPAALPPVKVEKPEGELLLSLDQAATSIQQVLTSCLRQYVGTRNSQSQLASKLYELDELRKPDFKKPQKPTPEEVMRYLMEVENQAARTLATEREAYQSYKQAQLYMTELKQVLERLQSEIARQRKVLEDTGNPLYTCVIEAANVLHSSMEKWLKEKEGSIESAQKRNLRKSDPVLSATADEAEQIKTLRQLERTVAFAVAQSVVAGNKLSTLRNNKPDEPRKPRVDREEDFARLLQRFDGYLATVEKTEAETVRWQAESQVVEMALAARSEKQGQSVAALMAKANLMQQSLKGKSGIADELWIVIDAATLLEQDNKT